MRKISQNKSDARRQFLGFMLSLVIGCIGTYAFLRALGDTLQWHSEYIHNHLQAP